MEAKQMRQTFFTVGAIVANSENYLPEWLTVHYMAGVERFVLVLEGECSNLEKQIKQLPFRNCIWIYRFREVWDRVKIYEWMLNKFGRKTHWIGFLETREFLFGTVEDDVRNILYRSPLTWLPAIRHSTIMRPVVSTTKHIIALFGSNRTLALLLFSTVFSKTGIRSFRF